MGPEDSISDDEDLQAQMYAMLHYVDDADCSVSHNETFQIVNLDDSSQIKSVQNSDRYWAQRSNIEVNNRFMKVNNNNAAIGNAVSISNYDNRFKSNTQNTFDVGNSTNAKYSSHQTGNKNYDQNTTTGLSNRGSQRNTNHLGSKRKNTKSRCSDDSHVTRWDISDNPLLQLDYNVNSNANTQNTFDVGYSTNAKYFSHQTGNKNYDQNTTVELSNRRSQKNTNHLGSKRKNTKSHCSDGSRATRWDIIDTHNSDNPLSQLDSNVNKNQTHCLEVERDTNEKCVNDSTSKIAVTKDVQSKNNGDFNKRKTVSDQQQRESSNKNHHDGHNTKECANKNDIPNSTDRRINVNHNKTPVKEAEQLGSSTKNMSINKSPKTPNKAAMQLPKKVTNNKANEVHQNQSTSEASLGSTSNTKGTPQTTKEQRKDIPAQESMNTPRTAQANPNRQSEDNHNFKNKHDRHATKKNNSRCQPLAKQNCDTKLIENNAIINLESSDDDSVIEVEVPRNPTTILLDSSDEDTLEMQDNSSQIKSKSPLVSETVKASPEIYLNTNAKDNRSCVSPGLSVSSVTDDFIENDCSLKENDQSNLCFNFGLHGSDMCDIPFNESATGSQKKYIKKTKLIDGPNSLIEISTPVLTSLDHCTPTTDNTPNLSNIECFATPKNKIKHKRRTKSKSYTVPDQTYVTPSIDIFYESESSDIPESVVDVPVTPLSRRAKKILESSVKTPKFTPTNVDNYISHDESIDETQLVMANVVGLDNSVNNDEVKDVGLSTTDKVTTIKHKSRKSKKLKTTKTFHEEILEEMNSFYNESWGTDFDHAKLQHQMPHGREFWAINSADQQRNKRSKHFIQCGFCNKRGHRDERCPVKPVVCIMCGATGHNHLRCPNKICLRCGSPNDSFTSGCRNCFPWRHMQCGICLEYEHPNIRCPDVWRRYHLTIKNELPLIQGAKKKPPSQLHCSGCTKVGHLVHNCKNYITFSDFMPASPYIFYYSSLYEPDVGNEEGTPTPTQLQLSTPVSSQVNDHQLTVDKKNILSQSNKDDTVVVNDDSSSTSKPNVSVAPSESVELVSNISVNDNTISTIMLTKDDMNCLNSPKGKQFLKQISTKFQIEMDKKFSILGNTITLTGNNDNNQRFHKELEIWLLGKRSPLPVNSLSPLDSYGFQIPKDRVCVLNLINKKLKILNGKVGDPDKIYYLYLKFQHQYNKACQEKVVKPGHLKTIVDRIKKQCKLLKIILIGQAGLDNGHVKIDKLRELVKNLNKQTSCEVSEPTRKAICELLEFIFSAKLRDDFSNLIEQYHMNIKNKMPVLLANPLSNKFKSKQESKLYIRLATAKSKMSHALRYQPSKDAKNIMRGIRKSMRDLKSNKIERESPTLYALKVLSSVDLYIAGL